MYTLSTQYLHTIYTVSSIYLGTGGGVRGSDEKMDLRPEGGLPLDWGGSEAGPWPQSWGAAADISTSGDTSLGTTTLQGWLLQAL